MCAGRGKEENEEEEGVATQWRCMGAGRRRGPMAQLTLFAAVHVAGDLRADVAPRRTRVWGYEPGPPAGTWSPR